jgi:hypothetical protein
MSGWDVGSIQGRVYFMLALWLRNVKSLERQFDERRRG